ncbi:13085_t:CDS:2 [Dentiscutata erythropus]|uniref:13085_t:CDS:1 n=1 Tax=Dentiscutata erythropus TaxID=1348616 RepID=A0A9N9ASI0_9GLOM|nr:13085_t:CDS:2 [Dentiscutata erythropus]
MERAEEFQADEIRVEKDEQEALKPSDTMVTNSNLRSMRKAIAKKKEIENKLTTSPRSSYQPPPIRHRILYLEV